MKYLSLNPPAVMRCRGHQGEIRKERSMKKKRDMILTLMLCVCFLAGLSVMLYPVFSNWWNRNMSSHTITKYKESVEQLDNSQTEKLLASARDYNERLARKAAPFSQFAEVPGYESALNVSGTGIMGYVSIPNINVELPIFHGTSEGVLQNAAGHIQGSSLPIGGRNTHAVISGHRGLPSAKLFTDLNQMVEGDLFTVNVLGEMMTYEVENIYIVLPNDTSKLAVIPGGDYVTLMTCTPYGVNSHRLLIRGRRIADDNARSIRVPADALQIERMKVMPFIFLPLLFLLNLYWFITGKRRRRIRIDRSITKQLPEQK